MYMLGVQFVVALGLWAERLPAQGPLDQRAAHPSPKARAGPWARSLQLAIPTLPLLIFHIKQLCLQFRLLFRN